ncbi:hypothetical protein DFJ73DRAFT_758441 [Zopfochytrium polystomum]|nr:hypothetical protein DFJ73DRAFT_758441 [Zopfochytrium polystomum]
MFLESGKDKEGVIVRGARASGEIKDKSYCQKGKSTNGSSQGKSKQAKPESEFPKGKVGGASRVIVRGKSQRWLISRSLMCREGWTVVMWKDEERDEDVVERRWQQGMRKSRTEH